LCVCLFENGIIIKPNNIGNTPLHAAALHGHIEVVKLLISKGADPNKVQMGGNTPFSLAVRYEKNMNEYVCLFYVLELLILKGADLYVMFMFVFSLCLFYVYVYVYVFILFYFILF